ncbi:hypothetical protein EJ08DRAFT_232097 [Tothia fuscella]|uniref:Uncharacterized protein n=1 Tax=Tothia fuscella TaxID=1048955 RepID=A0A9P4U4N5_9PEZI|nr:hypothetical protein EJ08DRAFT_232097 [Tothia fuscella]
MSPRKLSELPSSMEESVFVSIDLEGEIDNVCEIGLAICTHLPRPIGIRETYDSFVEDNDISCVTIRPREPSRHRARNQERLRLGEDAQGLDTDLEATIRGHLSRYASQNFILIAWDIRKELLWASRYYPNLLQLFSAYLDVQELAAEASKNYTPSLRHCLRSLNLFEGVYDGRRQTIPHRAANDVVYTPAALAALSSRPLDAPPLVIARTPKPPTKIFLGRPTPKFYPFTALIRTIDRTPLPRILDTAGKVATYFSSYKSIATGTGSTNRKWRNSEQHKEQLSWSWVSFRTQEELDLFLEDTNHTSVGRGKEIISENHYIPGVTLTREERALKTIEDGDRIREERKRARLLIEDFANGEILGSF